MFKIAPGQFEYIVSQSPQAVLGQFLIALLITPVLLSSGFPEINLMVWLSCVVTVLVYRHVHYRRIYRKRDFQTLPPSRGMINSFVIGVVLMGMLWSVLFAKMLAMPSQEPHFLAIVVGVGLSSAAVVTLGASLGVYAVFVVPMLLTLVIGLFLQASYLYTTAALFLLVGVAFALYTAKKYSQHFRIMQEVTEQLQQTEMEALICLGKAGEYRDSDTGDHVLRVGYSSFLLAKAAGLSEAEAQNLMYASPLHDLGKIGIPDHILLKPDSLTDEEIEAMKKHTRIGAEILKNSKSKVMKVAKIIALSHHEKWDGSGYPNGLSGQSIPIEGRIVAICDVFDALTSIRPYKKCWTQEQAVQYLRDNSATHFDPRLVELFIPLIPEIVNFSYRLEDHESATGIHPIIQLI